VTRAALGARYTWAVECGGLAERRRNMRGRWRDPFSDDLVESVGQKAFEESRVRFVQEEPVDRMPR
jgi:hypothetical protein